MTQVTIGMPVHNGAATISAALDSLLAQTCGDFVILISDNASTDGTETIGREYQRRDARIRYVRQPTNVGAAMNFRFVLFAARSPYFMWAAADDLWAPSFVTTHLAALRSNPRAMCSQSKVLFAVGGVVSHLSEGTYPLPHDPRRNVALFFANPADNSRYYGLFRTKALQSVFPTRSFHGLDWAVSAATLRFGTHVEVPDILMVRDCSDIAGYERTVAREHGFFLWRLFPVLFMTKWLLAGRQIPLSLATLYYLAKLNLRIHLRFALYRLGRLAETYLATGRMRGRPLLVVTRMIQSAVRPGLSQRLATQRRCITRPIFAVAHRVWRAMPLTLHRREAVKRHAFRLLGRYASAIPVFDGWVTIAPAVTARPPAIEMPVLPTGGWKLPVGRGATSPAVSAIIVACNDAMATLALIDSLVRTSGDLLLEIVVIDNASNDVTGFFGVLCPGVVYQRLPRVAPYGEAAVLGASLASSENLIFLEQRVLVRPDCIRQMRIALARAEMAGPQTRHADDSVRSAGGLGYGKSPLDPDCAHTCDVDVCPGAFAIRRSSLAAAGGIPADCATFEMAGFDLARRLHALAKQVLYWPLAAVTHYASSDTFHADHSRPSSRRLLYIDTDTPTPDRNAGSLEAINLMRLFGDFGFLVIFVPEGNLVHRGKYTEDLQALGIHALYYPYAASVREVLQRIGRELDVVVVCRASIADRYCDMIRELAPQARIVFNAVDLHGLRLMREAALTNDPRLAKAAKAVWASELASIAKADATIVVSSYEQALLARALPDGNVHVVPLVREVPERLDVPGFAERRDLMFIGTYQHPPNRDAVKYFAREIWPGIRAHLPDARFLVVGSSITNDIRALAGNGIEVLGFVQDLDPLLAKCRLTVAPLRYGAGLKGKIATSLLAGVPMVASGMAVEGTGLAHDAHILVADELTDFVSDVVRLYTDQALWQRLSAAGFEYIRREYSMAANIPRVEELLYSISRAPAAPRLQAAE